MLGSSSPVGGRSVPLAGPAPTPVATDGRISASQVRAGQQSAIDWSPWLVVVLVGLWYLWSVVEQHKKVQAAVQPKNVAINIRNLGAILLPVILGYALLRIALVKLQIWLRDVPILGDLVRALVHLVG